MDVSVVFVGAADQEDKDGPFYLTSTRGWLRFTQWVAALPETLFGSLRALAGTGRAENTIQLSLELTDVTNEYEPPDDVATIVRELLDKVGSGDEDETAVIIEGDEEEAGDAT